PSYFFFESDPKKRLENAELIINKNGFDSTKNYGMQSNDEHVKLLQFVITAKKFKTIREIDNYIQKHRIFNSIELASFLAKKDPKLLIEIIDILQISEELDQYKLIELITENLARYELPRLIQKFNKFTFSTPSNLKNIIDVLIRAYGVTVVMYLTIQFNSLGLTSDEDSYEISEYLANISPKDVAQHLKFIKIENPVYIKKLIAFLIKKSPKDMLRYFDVFHTNAEYRDNIARMLLSDLKKENLNANTDNPFQKVINSLITKIEQYRNKELQTFLTIHFLANLQDSPQYLKRFDDLTSDEKNGETIQHLLLPMVVISSLVNSAEDLSFAKEIAKMLSLSEIRKSLRNSAGCMQNLLQTLYGMEKSMEKNLDFLPSSKKIYFLHQALYCSKSDENEYKKNLDVLFSLFIRTDIFQEILHKLPENYTFESLLLEFITRIPAILHLNSPIDNFFDKYTNFENRMRIPNTLIKYVTKLEKLNDSSLFKDMQKLIHSILENQIEQDRYSVNNNPHLQFIQKEFPSIFAKWKVSLEPKNLHIDIKKQLIAVDTDNMQDLFLCGTEIEGSCQRIDGNPNDTKGLIAYVLDGKNRLLAIKDRETGKLQARCLLRLLLDSETKKPVLFQERIYPHNSKYSNQLNDLAKTKAEDLKLRLYNKNAYTGATQKIISLNNSLAYEYVDGMRKIVNNGKIEISAYQIN
ncbi:MAG: hypothetical protein ACRCSV_00885, partial [Chlamydiales bacterium]